MAYGEMTLDGDMNVTPYFEVMYNTQDYAQTVVLHSCFRTYLH